ncbi:MAG TPA: LamG domain-containing protein, partial [Phycisphaerales bacterium]|nr:LamG domain-containing protein [Phycisphaerales bacterium]
MRQNSDIDLSTSGHDLTIDANVTWCQHGHNLTVNNLLTNNGTIRKHASETTSTITGNAATSIDAPAAVYYSVGTSTADLNAGAATASIVAGANHDVGTATFTPLDPLSYWRFNDGTGTTLADEMGVYNGTITDPTWAIDGGVTAAAGDHALTLNGTSTYVDFGNVLGDVLEYNVPFSISSWVKTAQTGVSVNILHKSSGSSPYTGVTIFQNGSPDVIEFRIINNWSYSDRGIAIQSTNTVSDGAWHHVVGTYDGGGSYTGAKIYIDGVEEVTTVYGGHISIASSTANSASLEIGRVNYFNGSRDETAIFDYALDANQVTRLYNSGTPLNPAVVSLPSIGVGDTIEYTAAGGTRRAHISGKKSATEWYVTDSAGCAVSATSAPSACTIKRTFNGLIDALNGTSTDSGVYNLLGVSDLTPWGTSPSTTTKIYIPCYADGLDENTVGFKPTGWTTDTDHYFTIYAPTDTTSECNQSQK